jgi:hypothetical protein
MHHWINCHKMGTNQFIPGYPSTIGEAKVPFKPASDFLSPINGGKIFTKVSDFNTYVDAQPYRAVDTST